MEKTRFILKQRPRSYDLTPQQVVFREALAECGIKKGISRHQLVESMRDCIPEFYRRREMEPTDGAVPEAEVAEPITVFTAEHCVPCHEIVELLRKERFASDVGAPIDLIDIETEDGFDKVMLYLESVENNELTALPCAQYKGKTCKLQIDDERRVLLITCEEEEEGEEEGATTCEEEGNPT